MRAELKELKESYREINWNITALLSGGVGLSCYLAIRVWNAVRPHLASSHAGAWGKWLGVSCFATLALRPLTHWCFRIPNERHTPSSELLALAQGTTLAFPLLPITTPKATALFLYSLTATLVLGVRRLLFRENSEDAEVVDTPEQVAEDLTRSYSRCYKIKWEGQEIVLRAQVHLQQPTAPFSLISTQEIPPLLLEAIQNKDILRPIQTQRVETLGTVSPSLRDTAVKAIGQLHADYTRVSWLAHAAIASGGSALLFAIATVWNAIKPALAITSHRSWAIWMGVNLLTILALRPLIYWSLWTQESARNRKAELLSCMTGVFATHALSPRASWKSTALLILSLITTLALTIRRMVITREEEPLFDIGQSTLTPTIIAEFLKQSGGRRYQIDYKGQTIKIRAEIKPGDPVPFTLYALPQLLAQEIQAAPSFPREAPLRYFSYETSPAEASS